MTALAAQAEHAAELKATAYQELATVDRAMTGAATPDAMRQTLRALGDAAEALHNCRACGYVQPHDLAELTQRVLEAQMRAADWVEA